MFHTATVNTNSVDVIKYQDDMLLTTPFALALLCATSCERKCCKHNNRDYKYAKLINFFIENDCNFQLKKDKKCIAYFIRHFSFLSHVIPKEIYQGRG